MQLRGLIWLGTGVAPSSMSSHEREASMPAKPRDRIAAASALPAMVGGYSARSPRPQSRRSETSVFHINVISIDSGIWMQVNFC